METSFFRRSIAWIIDKIIIIPLFFITNIIIFGAYEAPSLFGYAMGCLDSTPFEAERYTPNNYLITFIFIFLAVNRVYYLLCELFFKRTFGKFAAKLDIRNLDSSPITVFKSFLRAISYWGSYLILLFILSLVFHNSVTWSKIILLTYFILLVPLYITNGTQTLYDLISLSRVLKRDKKTSTSAVISDSVMQETNASTVNDFVEAEPQLNVHYEQNKKTTISSKVKKTTEENWALTFISFILSFCIQNSLLRFYRYYHYYFFDRDFSDYYNRSYNMILDDYSLRIAFLALLSVVTFLVINEVYKKMIQKGKFYFPLNKGLNRLLLVVATILGSYNEIICSINQQFEIRKNTWISFFRFNDKEYSYYSGVFLFILLFCAYLIFVWIYRGFKEKND